MLSFLNQVIECSEKHKQRFIDISSQAFFNDPLYVAVFKKPEYRKKKLIPFFDETYRYGLKFGKIFASSANLEGMMICLPPENPYRTFLKEMKASTFKIFIQVIWPFIKGWSKADNCIGPAHKYNAPFKHWYIMAIAVDPKLQGQGYGSNLIQFIIKNAQESDLPVYLDTTNERNLNFYKRNGFKIVGEEVIPKLEVKSWYLLKDQSNYSRMT